MSKDKQSPASALLQRLQRAFAVGDYVKVRQLAQQLRDMDATQSASAQSWIERTQNDPINFWLALPIALLLVIATMITAG